MIRNINDYSNRLNLVEKPVADKLNKLARELKDSPFKQQLQETINRDIIGKVSSSQVKQKRDIKAEIESDPYRKKLYNASVEFESIFVNMVLKQMKNNIGKSDFISGGYAEEIFEDMLYDEYSRKLSANQKLGLAEQIYESLAPADTDNLTKNHIDTKR